MMEAKLCVVDGAKPAEIRLKLPTIIGRSRGASLKIKSAQISRRHCEVDQFEGELTVRDLGSSNGTYVNGQRIEDVTFLSPGDDLRIGPLTLRAKYQIEKPPAAGDGSAPTSAAPAPGEPHGGSDPVAADAAHDVVGNELTPDPSAAGVSSVVRYEEDDRGSFLGIEEIDADNPNQSRDASADTDSNSSSADQSPVDLDVGQEATPVDPADSQLNKFFKGLS